MSTGNHVKSWLLLKMESCKPLGLKTCPSIGQIKSEDPLFVYTCISLGITYCLCIKSSYLAMILKPQKVFVYYVLSVCHLAEPNS